MALLKITQRFRPRNLSAMLRKAYERTNDLRPVLKVAALQILSSAQINFRVGGRPKWPGLRLATLVRRGSTVGGGGLARPLLDTGRLVNSLVVGSGVPGPPKNAQLKSGGNVLRLTPRSITLGTNLSYAGFHQFGIGVPKREFLHEQPEDIKFIKLALGKYLKGDL